jgi:curved DNA-binding protein CbpA
MGTDHYTLLGVRSDASPREIRRAYRRLARQHHPDLSPRRDAPRRFAELAHAYAILNDPALRARYDQTLHRPVPVRRATPSPWPAHGRTADRGILELSPSETRHVARYPLALRNGYGRTFVVPAGTGHGEKLTLLYDGRSVVLTIHLHGRP